MSARVKNDKIKIISIVLLATITILLSWFIIRTLTANVESSAWNGVVASSFKSGTGTQNNPYVISSSSEFAYLKQLLESDNAVLYSNKNYVITTSLNYGNHNLSINNQIPFSGTINGEGNYISNASMTNSLFRDIQNATIENIGFTNINYTLSEEQS